MTITAVRMFCVLYRDELTIPPLGYTPYVNPDVWINEEDINGMISFKPQPAVFKPVVYPVSYVCVVPEKYDPEAIKRNVECSRKHGADFVVLPPTVPNEWAFGEVVQYTSLAHFKPS